MNYTRTLLVALGVLTLFVGAGVAQPAGGTGDAPGASGGGPPSDLPGPEVSERAGNATATGE